MAPPGSSWFLLAPHAPSWFLMMMMMMMMCVDMPVKARKKQNATKPIYWIIGFEQAD